MTIREFVLQQSPQGINEWLALIEAKGLQQHENLILECANHYDLITVNYSATFINAINI
jgi:hypothetical protein